MPLTPTLPNQMVHKNDEFHENVLFYTTGRFTVPNRGLTSFTDGFDCRFLTRETKTETNFFQTSKSNFNISTDRSAAKSTIDGVLCYILELLYIFIQLLPYISQCISQTMMKLMKIFI